MRVTGNDRSLSPCIEARVTSRSVIIPTGLPLSVTITLPTSNLTIMRNASSIFACTSTVITLVVMMDERTSIVVAFIISILPTLERVHYRWYMRLYYLLQLSNLTMSGSSRTQLVVVIHFDQPKFSYGHQLNFMSGCQP